jgi:putative phage-type endonuclease
MTAAEISDDHAKWLQARRFREGVGYCVGSSDVPAIMGVPKTGSPLKVWHSKVNGVEQPDNDPMKWGRRLEAPIAQAWRDRNSASIRAVGLIANVDQPWHQTTLDRIVLSCPLDKTGQRRCAVEIKNRNAFGIKRYHADLPDDILCQICHQIFVTGLDHIHYAVLIGGSDYRQGVVRADEDADTIAYVVKRVNAWRDTYLTVGAETPPEPDYTEHADALIELDKVLHPGARDGVIELADPDGLAAVTELAAVRAELAALTRREKAAKAKVLHIAAGSRAVKDPDNNLIFQLDPRGRSKTDLDKLREEFPEAYAACVTQTTGWQITIGDRYKPKTTKNDKE